MKQEQGTIEYDGFFLNSVEERIKIFNEISADNRAYLLKTQAERWLAVNRSRLNHQQITVVEEVIQSISPDWYEKRRDSVGVKPEAEALAKKLEAAFSREDVRDLATERARYIPAIKDEIG